MTTSDVAQQRADDIRAALTGLLDGRDRVLTLITQARDDGDADALAYPSWTAYVSTEFGQLLPRLSEGERVPFVTQLRALGMSTRAIAPIVGVDQSTVVRDLASTDAPASVDRVMSRDGRERPAVRAAPPPPRPEDVRRRAAWPPFRALMSHAVTDFVDGADALIAGHDWTDIDTLRTKIGVDSKAHVLQRLRRLHSATGRVIAAWEEHDGDPTIRRIK